MRSSPGRTLAVPRRLWRRALSASSVSPLPPPARPVVWFDCGAVDYATAWAWQRKLAQERYASGDKPDVVIALEHPHVFTLGRGATEKDLRFDMSNRPQAAEVHRVERGGQVTYHGPGQLVVYPILQLDHFRKDLRWYVTAIEQCIIDALGSFGVAAGRAAGYPGVWVADRKVAQVGISCSKWVTAHGFAVNVAPDLAFFDCIVPCGITDRAVTSLQRELERQQGAAVPATATAIAPPSVEQVHAAVRAAFARIFCAQLTIVRGYPAAAAGCATAAAAAGAASPTRP